MGPEFLKVILFVVFTWVVPVILCAYIWERKKGRMRGGILLGVFFGWIGVLFTLVASKTVVEAQEANSLKT